MTEDLPSTYTSLGFNPQHLKKKQNPYPPNELILKTISTQHFAGIKYKNYIYTSSQKEQTVLLKVQNASQTES